ncbi:minor teichoic acid biosynthesis protein GgaB [Tetragenococcus halophilus]|uniref:bifunctional glycosyltransferase/CDP-glycerol:glycerophosphate glycerophosphotransferase n=1 Tax=Tetragenococcus halophilus TaxID=51669 RepID=UPI001926E8E5|nr:CDP-glycerol glycerophosphotransferase family protein [Tetragenococcus halophilus]MDN6725190.1 CDP-glycerol:glycerophosphate glycerophosphotransferase [Tetragenococcus halophilus]GEQ38695.1 minor teichoic acid biosynthesis protein GgaB [Tetragenococcus halophilus]GEQ40971.1 minor teichoic acid biosynthesis protein GgaB [Tetragenococcus halophilus]GEQ43199.1 minor teichoic acid biosynthesis protein GgaB [Tetragenococcus halophilus]GEQ45485.1 minor teichoic acid biosynthesis protein GgaB [Tet
MHQLSNYIREVKRNDSKPEYKFSIITPAYNVENYIEETIESVFEQNWLENNKNQIQMIVINDGSTDNTWDKMKKSLGKYSNLVIINKENTGVSDSRNTGARYALGKYWNFLDSDDKLGESAVYNVNKILEANPDLKLVKMNRRYFEKYNGTPEFYMGDLKYSQTINTAKDPYHPIIHMSSIFFDNQLWDKDMFPVHLTYGEDAWVAGIMIEKVKEIYFSFEAVYCYRRRYSEDSIVDQHKGDPRKYIDQVRDFYIPYFKYIKKRFGFISSHIQSMIILYFSWNLKNKDDYDFLTKNYKDEYLEALYDTLSYCQSEVIMGETRLLNYYLRHTLLILKNTGEIPKNNLFYEPIIENIEDKETPVIRDYRNKRIERWDIRKARITVLKSLNGYVSILGDINTIFDLKFNENFKICFENSFGERFYFQKEFHTPFKSYWIMNDILKQVIGFSDNIPNAFFINSKYVRLLGFFKVDNKWYETQFDLNFVGHFAWLVNYTEGSFFPIDNKLVTYNRESKQFELEHLTKKNIKKNEDLVSNSLLSRDTKEDEHQIKKILLWRKTANILKGLKEKYKLTINCYMDRHNSSWDNATALLLEHNKHITSDTKTKNYFIVDKKSKSYRSLKKKNIKVIPFGSLRHKLLFLVADRLISSQANIANYNPFRKIWNNKMNDKLNFEYVFLQHGVNLRKLATYRDPWMTRTKLGIDQIIATNKLEYEHLTDTSNGSEFLPESVKLIGMARHDLLEVKKEPIETGSPKKILVMPTWRKNLSIWKSGDYVYNPAFKNSEHFMAWNSVLNNPKLRSFLSEYNAQLIFAPHPLEQIQIDDYDLKNVDQIIQKVVNYNKLINKTDAFITDFSSLGLDYFYENKPIFILNTNDDYWENFDNVLNYQSGKFGDVSRDVDGLVENVIVSLKNNFEVPSERKKFRDQFYKSEIGINISKEILLETNILNKK